MHRDAIYETTGDGWVPFAIARFPLHDRDIPRHPSLCPAGDEYLPCKLLGHTRKKLSDRNRATTPRIIRGGRKNAVLATHRRIFIPPYFYLAGKFGNVPF